MIIPVRCYSCGKVIAHIFEAYRKLLDEDYTEAEALEAVGAVRYCCRRMLLTHIDLIDNLMPYSSPVVGTMQKVRPAATLTITTSSSNASATTTAAASSSSGGSSAAAASTQPQQQQQQKRSTSANSKSGEAPQQPPQQVQGDAAAATSRKKNALQ